MSLCSVRPVQESFQKALRSLETGCDCSSLPRKWNRLDASEVVYRLRVPNPERVLVIKQVPDGAACLPCATATVQARVDSGFAVLAVLPVIHA